MICTKSSEDDFLFSRSVGARFPKYNGFFYGIEFVVKFRVPHILSQDHDFLFQEGFYVIKSGEVKRSSYLLGCSINQVISRNFCVAEYLYKINVD